MNMQEEEPLITLSSLSLGQKALIIGFSLDTKEGESIREMGLSPGREIRSCALSFLERSY